ncbi:MAG: hypothetical protein ACLQVX_18690 [Limisphaerales bacterium]
MSDWKVTDERSDVFGQACMTLGMSVVVNAVLGTEAPSTYTVENERTGEVREVYATGREALGRKIADGDFCDKKK